MAPQTYQLVMRTGPNPGQNFDLQEAEITIGRDVSNDIVISDAEISRHHARLTRQAGGYILEDTGSTNGTFVNGQRLMGPHLLRPGEVILLGENVSLVFQPTDYDLDATRVSASNLPEFPPEEEPARYAPAERYSGAQPARDWDMQASPPDEYGGAAEVFDVPEGEGRSTRSWIYIGCGCLVIVICILVGAAVVFDTLNLYCVPPFNTLFPC